MKKQISAAYIIVFLLLFIFPMGAYKLWGGHFDQTNFEKREAAEKPVFSINAIEEYPKAYEAYFNDSLPFRNQMITANSLLNLRLFQQSAVESVIAGKDGWLFYNPALTDKDPMADYYGISLYTQEQLATMASNLVSARDTLEAQGKAFVVMIAPNKVSMYGNEFLPNSMQRENAYTTADQVYDYLSNHTDLSIVYPKEQLFSAIQKDPDHTYYHKTDTHWNSLGGYIATKALLEQVGIYIPPIEEYKIVTTGKYAGDLAEMLGLQKYLTYDEAYDLSDYRKDLTKKQVDEIEDHIKVICTSEANTDERALFMIRDSFAKETMPYLAKQFQSCSFVRYGQYTPDLLQEYPSDIVVLEVVERYLSRLTNFKAE